MPTYGTEGLVLTSRYILRCKESLSRTKASGWFHLWSFVNHAQYGRIGLLGLLPRVENPKENFLSCSGKIRNGSLSWNGTQYMSELCAALVDFLK